MCETQTMNFVRPVDLSPKTEMAIGLTITASSLPASLKFRILGTATSPNAHSSILSNGLQPGGFLSGTKGLTPPIKEFRSDAARRIYLGGFNSTSVYSNIKAQAENNPDWIKNTKNFRFQCGFLFRPTRAILTYPIFAIVPEIVFKQNFMADDKSIVKIFKQKYFGIPNTVTIPGAYKSAIDYTLAPRYFLGSPQFDAKAIMSEAINGKIVNPARLMKGMTLFSIGTVLIIDACNRFSSNQDE